MRQRKEQGPHPKDERPHAQPPRLVALLPEVGDEDDDDHDGEVVAAGDEAAAGAGQAEAPLERGGDHVDDPVDGHALGDDEEAEEQEVALGIIEAL